MTPALDAASDFLRLREPVWSRFHARHPVYPRERFDDAYSEWWTREVERHVAGRPSRPVKPVAFIADAVHKVLIDEGRALARGLSRGEEKHALSFVGLDDLDGVVTSEEGPYRLLVHRILELVRERLTSREMAVFVASYLYLQPVSIAAVGLGLSQPRVRKDRARIIKKVGEEVWDVLQGELDLCAEYEERALPAVLELLTVHVDGCPHCRAQLQDVRRSAHAVVGPLELLAVGGAVGGASGLVEEGSARLSAVGDAIGARVSRVLEAFSGAGHRAAEVAVNLPPSGRTAAVVGVLVAATAGGGVAVDQAVRDGERGREREPQRAQRTAAPTPAPAAPTATPAPVRPLAPAAPAGSARSGSSTPGTAAGAERRQARAAERRRARAAERRRRARAAERRRRAAERRRAATPSAPTPAPTAAPTAVPAAPAPPDGGGAEFGFEAG